MQKLVSPRAITADNAWIHASVRLAEAFEVQSILRAGIPGGEPQQILAEIAAPGWIRQYAFTPDDRTLAFTTSSESGLTTQLVDLSGDTPSRLTIADHGHAPVILGLVPSPDSNFVAAVMSHGAYPDEVALIRRDAPEQAVLVVEDLVAEPAWLP